jgi:hypothetical protein
MPGIWRTSHTLMKDARVVKDRLHARNNGNCEDYSLVSAATAERADLTTTSRVWRPTSLEEQPTVDLSRHQWTCKSSPSYSRR